MPAGEFLCMSNILLDPLTTQQLRANVLGWRGGADGSDEAVQHNWKTFAFFKISFRMFVSAPDGICLGRKWYQQAVFLRQTRVTFLPAKFGFVQLFFSAGRQTD